MWLPVVHSAEGAKAEGLLQFGARPSWRPAARIFVAQGLRDASGQRPFLAWDVAVRGSANGHAGEVGEDWSDTAAAVGVGG